MKQLYILFLIMVLLATTYTPQLYNGDKGVTAYNSISVENGDCTSGELEPLYPTRKVLQVKYIGQEPSYPCGCEGVSAVMLLDYHGFKVSTDYFFDNVLDTFPFTYNERTDTYYGEDMDRFYVGDPRSELGKGCYAPVIKTAMEKIVSADYVAVVEQGGTVSQLVDLYLKKLNTPFLIWATSGMRDSYEGTTWNIARTGKTYTFPAFMHCLVLVGYDDERNVYYFNDPWKNRGLVAYDKDLVEAKFKELGSQALALIPRYEYKAKTADIDYNKTYAIRNAATGKYITVFDESLIQSTFQHKSLQLFTIAKHDDGSVSFINKGTNKALEAIGLNIKLGVLKGSVFQRFEICFLDNGFIRISPTEDKASVVCTYGNYNGDGRVTSDSTGKICLDTAESASLYGLWELVPV